MNLSEDPKVARARAKEHAAHAELMRIERLAWLDFDQQRAKHNVAKAKAQWVKASRAYAKALEPYNIFSYGS
jgi:hypothetical protein